MSCFSQRPSPFRNLGKKRLRTRSPYWPPTLKPSKQTRKAKSSAAGTAHHLRTGSVSPLPCARSPLPDEPPTVSPPWVVPAPIADRKASQVSIRTPEVEGGPAASSGRSRRSVARSERIKRRRGLTQLAMALVLPGSAQLAPGNRRLGRVALWIWATAWLLAQLAALLALLLSEAALAVVTFGPTLIGLQIVIITLGLGRVVLMVDAWRLAHPWGLERWGQIFSALSLALALIIFGGFIAVASMDSGRHVLTTTVFGGGGDQVAKQVRYNVLLMGGDAERHRVGLRPDTMTVASVHSETGRTVLIRLPGKLQAVPFPSHSPLHTRFPLGFRCADRSCRLNGIYTYASEHRELYPSAPNPGAQATKEAVEAATGLTINYWVLIDLKGFESLDSVGGITMDVDRRVPIGGGSSRIDGYVEAGKDRHLNGFEALWFAGYRSDSSAYDRIVVQKCVVNAMLDLLGQVTVLSKFDKIAAAGKEVAATDIPPSGIGTMIDLALKAKELPVSSAAMMPPLVNPSSPDYDLIRRTVQKSIEASEASDERARSAQNKGWAAAQAGGSNSGGTTACHASGGISRSTLGNKVVQIALAEVGTVESPRGSDRGEPCKYQGSGCPQAWCADFASWVYKQAGATFSDGTDGGWRIASSRSLADYWKKNGVWIQNPGRPVPVNDPRSPHPGDIVWYPGHTNIVVSYDGKTVKTVGGNEFQAVTVGTGWDVFKEAYGWGRPK